MCKAPTKIRKQIFKQTPPKKTKINVNNVSVNNVALSQVTKNIMFFTFDLKIEPSLLSFRPQVEYYVSKFVRKVLYTNHVAFVSCPKPLGP